MFFPTISFIYSDDTDLFGLCGVSTTSVPEPSSGLYGATLGADGAIFASEGRRYAARVLAVACSALLATAPAGRAGNKDWATAGGSGWNIAANWSPTGIPTSSNNVSIGNGGKAILASGTTGFANGFHIGRRHVGTAVPNSSLEIQAGSSLATKDATVGWNQQTASATVAGIWNAQSLIVGGSYTSSVSILAGGKLATGSLDVQRFGTLDVAGEVTASGIIYVTGGYEAAPGILRVNSGGKLNSAAFVTSDGTVIVGNGGEWNQNWDYIQLGGNGPGRLRIEGTGKVSVKSGTGMVRLGENAGGAGVLQLGNNSAAGTLLASGITTGSGFGSVYFKHTGNHIFPVPIHGTTLLIKEGTGTTTVTGPNSYTGETAVKSGKLVLGNATALGTDEGYLSLENNATLDLNGISLAKAFIFSDSFQPRIESGVAGQVILTLRAAQNQTYTYGGKILDGSGTLTLVKEGAFTQILRNVNGYSGGTIIRSGTLRVESVGGLGSGPVTIEGGTLLLEPGVILTNQISFNGGSFSRILLSGTNLSTVVDVSSNLGGTITAAAVLDGQITAPGTITTQFTITSPATNDTDRRSSVFGLSGMPVVDIATGRTDTFVLRMRHAAVDESSILAWYDPALGRWRNAINGNHSGSPNFAGNRPYNPATDFTVGTYGVDTAEKTVWAVLNHNSAFAAVENTASSTPGELLSQKVAAAGLSGNDALPGATPFNDGVENLLKYAFNMNLSGPDTRTLPPGTGTAGLPSVGLIGIGATTQIKVEFLRRKGSGLIYTPKRSTTLEPGSFQAMTATQTVISIDDNWERVIVQESADPTTLPKSFAIVEVKLP